MCAWLYLYPYVAALDGWNLYRAAQCCRGEVEQEVVEEIVAVAHEGVVGFLLNIYLYVAIDAVMFACVALARNVDYHSLSYSCGDVDLNDLLALDNTFTVTVVALVLDDFTLATTYMTGGLGLHHSEDALLGAYLHARSMTVGAGLAVAAVLSTTSVAMRTGDVFLYLELLGYSSGNLL